MTVMNPLNPAHVLMSYCSKIFVVAEENHNAKEYVYILKHGMT
jgi:hypothetical protein